MARIDIMMCETLPPRDALSGILSQYYGNIVSRMITMGIDMDPDAPRSALAEFWTNAGDYLPPDGCIALAKDQNGQIVGCGMMKRLDRDTGELKRDFVTEAARGTGMGRALVQARIDAARAMGLKRLVADTLLPNVEMQSLYPKLGFRKLAEPIETTTYLGQPMLRPYMLYYAMDLDSPPAR